MQEQWQELKETIIELRDNNGTATQQEVCKFLVNLMDILEETYKSNCPFYVIDDDGHGICKNHRYILD